MDDFSQRYYEWMNTRNAAEEKLYHTALDYDENYFQDMRFAEDSLIAPFLKYKETGDDGIMVDQFHDIPTEFTCIITNRYRFLIASLDDDTYAVANSKEKTVTFAPEHAENKGVILHELIHVHEFLLEHCWSQFREKLLLQLYSKLKECISDLDDRIIAHAHIIPGSDVAKIGGTHGILFFLKSLELDLECKWPLGTVCMYDRNNYDS